MILGIAQKHYSEVLNPISHNQMFDHLNPHSEREDSADIWPSNLTSFRSDMSNSDNSSRIVSLSQMKRDSKYAKMPSNKNELFNKKPRQKRISALKGVSEFEFGIGNLAKTKTNVKEKKDVSPERKNVSQANW